MKEEIAMKWIKALRSGKYKQTTGSLKGMDANGDEAYCCLGVLQEIQGFDINKGNTLLSTEAQQACEMHSKNGQFIPGRRLYRLSYGNDKGDTFEEIADIIEKHWRLL